MADSRCWMGESNLWCSCVEWCTILSKVALWNCGVSRSTAESRSVSRSLGEDVPRHRRSGLLSVPRVMTCGVVFIHSTPAALCPHIIWALESVLGEPVALEWARQPQGTKLLRTEMSWVGEAGTGGKMASGASLAYPGHLRAQQLGSLWLAGPLQGDWLTQHRLQGPYDVRAQRGRGGVNKHHTARHN